jgi:hypothetical protein
MKPFKNIIKILLITLIAALLIGGGYIFWQNNALRNEIETLKSQNQNLVLLSSQKSVKATTSSQEISTNDWLTYRNENYGYEIQYPKDWKAGADIEGSDGGDVYVNESAATIGGEFHISFSSDDPGDSKFAAEKDMEKNYQPFSFDTYTSDRTCNVGFASNKFNGNVVDTCIFTRVEDTPESNIFNSEKFVYFRFFDKNDKYFIGKINFPLASKIGDTVDENGIIYQKILSTFKFIR